MNDWDLQLMRSLLFVPGNDERKLAKAGTFGADMIVIDLEDAVADDQKMAARASTRAAVTRYGEDTAIAVRVNGITTGQLEEDVMAVVTTGLDAIMVPKVEDADTLERVDVTIAAAERAAGLEAGMTRLLVLIETPLGLTRCESILAGAPARVHTAVLGTGDFTTALGVGLTVDATEILYARSRLVVAACAAGLAPPIDGAWLRLDDIEGLKVDSALSRQLGFQGRVTIHPPQVEPVQRSYSVLGDEEALRVRRIVEAFEEAEGRGVASLCVDGQFVDYPIYRLARNRIRRYDACAGRPNTQ